MVTPELLEYVRTEVGRGRTREEIHTALISGGGWNEADVSEAFRVVIPMQGIILPKENPIESAPFPLFLPSFPSPVLSPSPLPSSPSSSYLPSTSLPESSPPSPSKSTSYSGFSLSWQDSLFIIIGIISIFSWYFYHPQIALFWNRGIKSSQELSVDSWNSLEKFSVSLERSSVAFFDSTFDSTLNNLKRIRLPSFNWPSFNFSFLNKNKDVVTNTLPENHINNKATLAPMIPVAQPIVQVKDCGIGVAPKLDNPHAYRDNPALSCLGESAASCENSKGVLKDDLFPTIFEVVKSRDSCNFKLSYPADSVLTDISGRKLAGQYISCPINIVKAIDNTNPATPKFIPIVRTKTDSIQYASQIYLYGTLGLFAENNLDINKIRGLGCEGPYIQSMIDSYRATQPK